MYGSKWALKIVTVAFAGVCVIHSGLAADIPVAAAPAPAPAFNWTGFYLGADISQNFATALYKRPFDTSLSDTSIGSINLNTGVGGYVGFNFQASPWLVVGLEASDTWLGSMIREQGPTYDFLEHVNSVIAVTGRAGVLVRPDTMIYGKVGPAWMHVSGFEGFSGILNQNVVGAQVGLGIETLVTPNVAIRAEASYTGATQALTLNSGSDRYSPSILQLQLGAEYKFDAPGGWGARAAAPVFSGAAPPTWTGVEIGGFVSVNGNQETYNDTNQGQTGPFARFAVGGGAFVDANYEIAQRYVVGAEFSGNYDHAKFVNAAGTNGYYGPLFDFGTVESVWALTGRVGWLASPGTLFYVKGGAAWVDTTTDFGYWNNVAPNGSGNKMLPGYQVGIGAETFVTQNVSVRVEALYTGITRRIDLNGSINANEFALEPSILSATTGVAYHF